VRASRIFRKIAVCTSSSRFTVRREKNERQRRNVSRRHRGFLWHRGSQCHEDSCFHGVTVLWWCSSRLGLGSSVGGDVASTGAGAHLSSALKGGRHPSPATVLRMLREHDEKTAVAATTHVADSPNVVLEDQRHGGRSVASTWDCSLTPLHSSSPHSSYSLRGRAKTSLGTASVIDPAEVRGLVQLATGVRRLSRCA
jgi:hypothetical protein